MFKRLVRWVLAFATAVAVAVLVNRRLGNPVPVLRISFLRFIAAQPRVRRTGQTGDGRELALSAYVGAHSRRGDIDDVIRACDEFARTRSFLMSVGDEKGALLDAAVAAAAPKRLLELGTYCGYSALRTVRAMPPGARLFTIEPNSANAAIARQIWEHAGVADRVTAIVGMLGDSGATMAKLERDYGFRPESLDFVFLDHNKDAYLGDLRRIIDAGWLHPGSVVLADNVKAPGAPDYLAYLRANEATEWTTVEHYTHAEYQKLIKDLVTESTYLGTEPAA